MPEKTRKRIKQTRRKEKRTLFSPPPFSFVSFCLFLSSPPAQNVADIAFGSDFGEKGIALVGEVREKRERQVGGWILSRALLC